MRILAAALGVSVLFTAYPNIPGTLCAYAAENDREQNALYVTGFTKLPKEIEEQTVSMGTKQKELALPDTLEAVTVQNDGGPAGNGGKPDDGTLTLSFNAIVPEYRSDNRNVLIEGVTWQSEPAYDGDAEGTYRFTPVLPEGYGLLEGVSLPQITVTVQGENARVQALLVRIETLPDVWEYMEKEPDTDNREEDWDAYENAYKKWMAELCAYAKEALSILEEAESLSEEEYAQIPQEALDRLAAWAEITKRLADNEFMLAADGTAAPGIITSDEEWSGQTLAAGTYTINPGVTVTLKGEININGAVTIQGGGRLVRGDAAACFRAAGSGNHLTLQNIEADGASLSSGYSLISVSSGAEVTLGDGCRIHHCIKNFSQGAALNLYNANAVLDNAVIENCQSTSYGGAVYIDGGSSLTIQTGTYRDNSTTGTSQYGGGFIYNSSSTLKIYGGSYIGNISTGKAGCIYNTGKAGTETYLYGGYFQGNKSSYGSYEGSGAVLYSAYTASETILNLSGNVQFCGDGASGVDGVFLDLKANTSIRKARISSEFKYPIPLYLNAEEGRVIAEGVDGYRLQKKDMKKITFYDVGSSGQVWYAKLDEENNQVVLTTTDPHYSLYVTYAANGGEGSVSDGREYESGDTVTVQPGTALSRSGYTFDGWNTKPDGTGVSYPAGGSFQITDDVTLYAKWTADSYSVTYNKNGGTIANENSYTKYTYGTGLTLPAPTREGYTFGGWYTNSDLSGTAVTDISATATGDKTYYAKWTDATRPNAPVLQNGVTLPAGWANTQTTIPLTLYDGVGVTQLLVSVDNGTYTEVGGFTGNAGTAAYAYAVSEGNHTYRFKAKDGAGNISAESDAFTVKQDTTAPVIGTLAYENKAADLWQWIIGKKSMIIHVPVTEGGSGADKITYTMTPADGSPQVFRSANINNGVADITFAEDFRGNITIICSDAAGNIAESVSVSASGNGGVIVENNAPAVTFTLPNTPQSNSSGWYREPFSVTVTVTDDKQDGSTKVISGGIAGITWKDGEDGAEQTVEGLPGISPVYEKAFTIAVNTDGTHTYYVKTADNAGNESGWKTVTVRLDRGNPVFNGSTTTGNVTSDGADITFTSSEGGKVYWIVDPAETPVSAREVVEGARGGTDKGGSKEITGGLPEGISITGLTPEEAHRVCIVLEDAAGNLSEVKEIVFTTLHEIPPVKTVVEEALAGITVGNGTTKESIQDAISAALDRAGITDVTVTVENFVKTDAGSGMEGSIRGNVSIINNKDGSVKESFVIDKTIPAIGTEPEAGTVVSKVKSGENAPMTNISTPTAKLEEMLLTDEEKQQVQNGTNIRIVLEVQDAGNTVSGSDKETVEQALNGFTVGQYLNIDLYKLAGADRTDIHETAKKIRIVIAVPEALRNTDSSKTRTFAVVRVHDGRAELLTDLDGSADTITIETDRFSTYAIVYKDTANGGGGNNGNDNNGGGNDNVGSGNNGNGNNNGGSGNNGSGNNSGNNNSGQNNSVINNTKPGSQKDNEPATGDAAPLEVYATLAMIAGFSYVLLYFTDRERGMTEETKKELVSRLVGWAKQGGRIRKYLALAAVFVLLVYYHGIGKETCAEWKEIYGE